MPLPGPRAGACRGCVRPQPERHLNRLWRNGPIPLRRRCGTLPTSGPRTGCLRSVQEFGQGVGGAGVREAGETVQVLDRVEQAVVGVRRGRIDAAQALADRREEDAAAAVLVTRSFV